MFTQAQVLSVIALSRGFSEARALNFWYDLEGADSELESFIAEAATVVDEVFTENPGHYNDRAIAEQVGSYIMGYFIDNLTTPSLDEIKELVVGLITDKED